MHSADKLLLALNLGRGLLDRWRFQRIFSFMLTLLLLAMVTAVLVSIVAAGVLYFAYLYLLSLGIEPVMALLQTGLLATLAIVALLMIIRQRVLSLKSVMSTQMGRAVDSFLDGVLAD